MWRQVSSGAHFRTPCDKHNFREPELQENTQESEEEEDVDESWTDEKVQEEIDRISLLRDLKGLTLNV